MNFLSTNTCIHPVDPTSLVPRPEVGSNGCISLTKSCSTTSNIAFFIQDIEGQVFREDHCFAKIVKAHKLNFIEQKLSKSLEDWKPSLTGTISYWAAQHEICLMCRDTFHCQLHLEKQPNFKELTMEVYGRKIVQNLLINTLILGGKLVLSYGAGGAKAGSNLRLWNILASLLLYTLEKQWDYLEAHVLECWEVNNGILGGALLGLVPWIYCELRLESFARLFFDEEYL